MIRTLINFIIRKVSALLGTSKINQIERQINHIEDVVSNIYIDNYLKDNLFLNKKYINSNRITIHHKSVFTQNGEDGILEEIFNRLGIKNGYFVEFGVHGIKNNSTYLLIKGWKGVWIGGGSKAGLEINKIFKQQIGSKDLIFSKYWITKDNIENIFKTLNINTEFDYLSIDIDGNDYWVWEAIKSYKPKVVSIEYNATFPSETSWVMAYNPNHHWEQNSYFGASLKALEILGEKKGYKLIGCDFTGCNAFFVRSDQNIEAFQHPYTAEFHYEPPRYFLKKATGHLQGFGPFDIIK